MAKVELKNLTKKYGDVIAVQNLDLSIPHNEFLVLVGPSGCGKSTTLRMIAGLEEITSGEIYIGDQLVNEKDPKDRNVSMVFQNYALYPHMTVKENLGFSLKIAKVDKKEIEKRVKEAVQILGLDELQKRKPSQLSGGQKQRVAMGRAIVRRPDAFLFDEPLSNLDAKLRLETRVELKNLQKSLNVTTVYVTHDQEEAMTLANRMAVFLEGKIMQVGTPTEIFNNPKTLQVASFIGNPPMNLLEGEIMNNQLTISGVKIKNYEIKKDNFKKIIVGIRPGELNISNEGIPAKIYLIEQLGDSTIMNLIINDKIVKLKSTENKNFKENSQVFVNINSDKIYLFDPETGLRI